MGGAAAPGMGGATAPGMGGAAAGVTGAGPAGAVAARVVEPLEKSRPNPFTAYAGAGLLAARPSAGLAFMPSYHTMPVGVFQQHQFPVRGAQGQSIKVPGPKSLRLPTGPEAPPQEDYIRAVAVIYDNRGMAATILERQGRQETYRVGDRFNDTRGRRWTVQSISKTEVVISREEAGKTVTRRLRVVQGTGGGTRTPGPPAPGTGGQPPGGGRRPGGAGPGGFPGVPGGGGRPPGAGGRPGGGVSGTATQ
jgi:hypothetical protein